MCLSYTSGDILEEVLLRKFPHFGIRIQVGMIKNIWVSLTLKKMKWNFRKVNNNNNKIKKEESSHITVQILSPADKTNIEALDFFPLI